MLPPHLPLSPPVKSPVTLYEIFPNFMNSKFLQAGILSSPLPWFFWCPLCPSCPHGLLSFCHLALAGTKYQRAVWASWKISGASHGKPVRNPSSHGKPVRNLSSHGKSVRNPAIKPLRNPFTKSQQLAGDRRYFRVWHG